MYQARGSGEEVSISINALQPTPWNAFAFQAIVPGAADLVSLGFTNGDAFARRCKGVRVSVAACKGGCRAKRGYVEDSVYLGTAFFVTKRGDAIASAHTIPAPEDLPPGRRLIAVVVIDGKQTPCWVNYVAVFNDIDLVLVKVNLQSTKFLRVSFETVANGIDVALIGIPDHSVTRTGKQMRTLKGHVTLSVLEKPLN